VFNNGYFTAMDSIVHEMNRSMNRAGMTSTLLVLSFSLLLLNIEILIKGVPFGSWVIVGALLVALGFHLLCSLQFLFSYARFSLLRRKSLVEMLSPGKANLVDDRVDLLIAIVENQSVRAMNFLYLQIYSSWAVYSLFAALSLAVRVPKFGLEWIVVGVFFLLGMIGMVASILGDLRASRKFLRLMASEL
jgi:hypothetical protein